MCDFEEILRLYMSMPKSEQYTLPKRRLVRVFKFRQGPVEGISHRYFVSKRVIRRVQFYGIYKHASDVQILDDDTDLIFKDTTIKHVGKELFYELGYAYRANSSKSWKNSKIKAQWAKTLKRP